MQRSPMFGGPPGGPGIDAGSGGGRPGGPSTGARRGAPDRNQLTAFIQQQGNVPAHVALQRMSDTFFGGDAAAARAALSGQGGQPGAGPVQPGQGPRGPMTPWQGEGPQHTGPAPYDGMRPQRPNPGVVGRQGSNLQPGWRMDPNRPDRPAPARSHAAGRHTGAHSASRRRFRWWCPQAATGIPGSPGMGPGGIPIPPNVGGGPGGGIPNGGRSPEDARRARNEEFTGSATGREQLFNQFLNTNPNYHDISPLMRSILRDREGQAQSSFALQQLQNPEGGGNFRSFLDNMGVGGLLNMDIGSQFQQHGLGGGGMGMGGLPGQGQSLSDFANSGPDERNSGRVARRRKQGQLCSRPDSTAYAGAGQPRLAGLC